MSDNVILLTELDHTRLVEMVEKLRKQADPDTNRCLDLLANELTRAVTIEPDLTPLEAVTMNSRVQIRDLDTGKEEVYTVTWPDEANFEEGKVSVLAPVGMALLGSCVGQVIEWQVPAGKRCFQVEKILYQPEANGDFDA